jgi:hypothetical protein
MSDWDRLFFAFGAACSALTLVLAIAILAAVSR